MAIPDRIERRQYVGREPAGLAQHRIDQVLGEIAVEPLRQRRPEAARMLERKGDVGDRRPVGNGILLRLTG